MEGSDFFIDTIKEVIVDSNLELASLSPVIQDLVVLQKMDSALNTAIAQSLTLSQKEAEEKLASDLYQHLEWPLPVATDNGSYNLDSYFEYLQWFICWKPVEDPESYWQSSPGVLGRALGTQEIYDRLCHFYFLINRDVIVGDSGELLQNYPSFAKWLDDYAIAWGAFLSTSQSFSMNEVQDFIDNSPLYDVKASLLNDEPPYQPVNGPWDTFNDFFARTLKPGERPITSPQSNFTVTRPADCTYHEQYPIGENGEVGELYIKGMSAPATVGELLGDDKYNDVFAGGLFVHYFLAPYSYHRFHAPVSGKLSDFDVVTKNLNGSQTQAYLAVDIDAQGQFDAPDSSADGYEFVQTRGFVVIDTEGAQEGDIGMVAAIPVGMCQVSSVVLKDQYGYELEEGGTISKGDQFGFFQFGGSDIIVLIQAPTYKKAEINTHINPIPGVYKPDYYHYGTEIMTIENS